MAWLKLITWRHWQFHLALLNRISWHYWTVLPGVTGPYHLTLLDSFTWRYWTVSPDVTGQFHLALLDRITWRYWAVSLVMTEPIGQFRLALLKPIYLTLQDSNRAVQYATTNSLICDWSQSTWQISQSDDIERSADRYLANNWQIKRALPARQTIASRVTSFTIHNIPEFSRKLTYFLRSFLNTGFCRHSWIFQKTDLFLKVILNTDVAGENDDFFSFCFAEFVDC